MLGEIIKIEKKNSKNGGKFILVNFKLENGKFAQTYLVPSFRNFRRWKKYLKEGNIIANLKLKNPGQVDADSLVFLFQGEKTKGRDLPLKEEEMFKMGVFG